MLSEEDGGRLLLKCDSPARGARPGKLEAPLPNNLSSQSESANDPEGLMMLSSRSRDEGDSNLIPKK